jgi:DNA polymerase-3 subunit gamma/tau
MWRLLLQGFEDCARAPDPPAAAQMVVLRLAAAASLPSPEDAMKMLAGGAAVPAPKSQPEREPVRNDAPVATFAPPVHHDEPHEGVRLSTLREIIGELEARREISLTYEIERYVRPADIGFGHFHYAAAPGAPGNLSQKIKDWLEAVSGVEWDVDQANDVSAESLREKRDRRVSERMQAAQAHPRIAEALKLFPGAKVLRVDDPAEQDDLDDAPASPNVIHVDFGFRERAEEVIPDPEEREDDE